MWGGGGGGGVKDKTKKSVLSQQIVIQKSSISGTKGWGVVKYAFSVKSLFKIYSKIDV